MLQLCLQVNRVLSIRAAQGWSQNVWPTLLHGKRNPSRRLKNGKYNGKAFYVTAWEEVVFCHVLIVFLWCPFMGITEEISICKGRALSPSLYPWWALGAVFTLTGLDEIGEIYIYKPLPKPFHTEITDDCVALMCVLRLGFALILWF